LRFKHTFDIFHARPYSILARDYDSALGLDSFRHIRDLFEKLVRELGFHFSSAADVGCGTGLFARHLCRRWRVPVFAVDRAPAMLRVARRNCCGTGVHVLQQDLRALRLPAPVDLITANFDVLNHLVHREDLGRALRCIAENLVPGGHLIFDFLTHCQALPSSVPYLQRLRGVGGEVQQWIRWDPERHILSTRMVHPFPAVPTQAVELHHERAYTPEEMGRALAGAGLIIRTVRDAITLRPAVTCLPRLRIVAQKPTRSVRRS
jgi:SAM-dependent methyltransferase